MNFMKKFLLTSSARFSPPDDLGNGSNPWVMDGNTNNDSNNSNNVPDNSANDTNNTNNEVIDEAKPRVESVTDSVRRAIKETKNKAEKTDKSAQPDKSQTNGAPNSDKSVKTNSEEKPEGNTETASQGQTGAPQAWKAEEKAVWDSLPEVARQAINRREADTTKGVQELKTRYQEIDTAIAPYHAVMKQNNVTPGQAVNQLFKWHMELAGPNKVQAFKQLAQSFGIDPSTLVASQSPDTQNNTNQTIPDNLKPIIEGLESRLKGYETNVAAQNQAAAQQTWSNWAKDKPHAEAVRMLMANLINSDLALMQSGQPQVSNTVKNGSIDMDTAYQAATYAHPEVRQLVLQEEQKKRDTAARDAAEKARKAGGSLRTGAPGGKVNSPNGNDALKVESPRESIQRALAEIKQR